MKKEKGFTLIELLVVISVIAVLMSLMMPALNKAKLAVKDSMDLSNQHQFGLFWKLYTDDHDGKFPERGGSTVWGSETMGGWPFVLYTYMPTMDKRIWHCPAATKPLQEGGRYPYAAWNTDLTDPPVVYGSYTVNYWVANDPEDGYWCTPNVKGAAFAPLLLDGNWKDMEPYEVDQPFQTREEMVELGWTSGPDDEMRRACIDRHGIHVNACFLDMSAKKIGLKWLWRTRWNRIWDMTVPLPVWPAWLQKCSEPEW